MTQTISGSDGRYFYAIPQTQSEIELAWKDTVPFFCLFNTNSHMKYLKDGYFHFELCLVIPRTMYFHNFEIQSEMEIITHDGMETGELEKIYSLSCREYGDSYFSPIELLGSNLPKYLCPLLIPISELPFDMGLLIQLIEKSPTFQTAMSQITPQIELIEAEHVNS